MSFLFLHNRTPQLTINKIKQISLIILVRSLSFVSLCRKPQNGRENCVTNRMCISVFSTRFVLNICSYDKYLESYPETPIYSNASDVFVFVQLTHNYIMLSNIGKIQNRLITVVISAMSAAEILSQLPLIDILAFLTLKLIRLFFYVIAQGRILLETLVMSQRIKKSPYFIEIEISLPYSCCLTMHLSLMNSFIILASNFLMSHLKFCYSPICS